MKVKLSPKTPIFFLGGLIMAGAISWLCWHYFISPRLNISQSPNIATTTQRTGEIKHNPCLGAGEAVDYKIKTRDEYYGEVSITIDGHSFEIPNVRLSVHPIEIHSCGVYLIREFNINYAKAEFLPDFNYTLWKYDYGGNSTKLITLAERRGDQKVVIHYSTEFRIAPKKTYLSLIRGSLDRSDYAIVIKDINTLKDVFILPITEIEKRDPDLVNDISFESGGWTKDGRYFWANTHDGANTLGFIRIDSKDWSYDIFPAPKDVLGGDALNLENGYITIHPGNIWFGVSDLYEVEKEKRRVQGIGTELYIENFITGKRLFITETDEPLWYFKPKWLSDTELEYTLPTGEKKVYKIEE